MCQIRTVWSLEQLAMSSPQGLTLAILTHSLWPVSVFTQYPVATSHILMVLSRDALTTKSPCGTNETELTLWSWPCIVLTQANVWVKSQSFIDMSALHDTSSLPVGSNATSCTLSVWPFRVRSNSPVSKSQTCDKFGKEVMNFYSVIIFWSIWFLFLFKDVLQMHRWAKNLKRKSNIRILHTNNFEKLLTNWQKNCLNRRIN